MTSSLLVPSQRVERLPDSPIRKLGQLAEQVQQQGVKIYHLNIGQPDIPTPECFLDRIKKNHPAVIRYSQSNGELELRKGMAEHYNSFYGTDLTDKHILVTVGSSEAIVFTLFASTDEGDEVLTPDPCYTNYLSLAQIVKTNITTIPSKIEHQFSLPPVEEFRKKISSKTKAILICNPNNPTGYSYTKAELLSIAELCKEKNLFFIVDEAYRELEYESSSSFALKDLSMFSERIMVLDSVSKRYSACGARVGFIVSKNETILKKIIKIANARLSPPFIDQVGVMSFLSLPKTYYQDMRQVYVKRRDLMLKELQSMEGVFCPKPQGAFYICCQLPVKDSDEFCRWLLQDFRYQNTTVMLTPLGGFYQNPELGKNQIRIAYVLQEDDLLAAANCLRIALKAYKG